MQIGIVCYPTIGGSGVIATELARALACRGHTVHLISSELPIRLTACLPNLYFHQVIPPDYPVFQYRPYESALAGRLVRLVEGGMELVHVHYAIPHAVSAYLAQQTLAYQGKALPVITTLHGTDTSLVSQDPDLYPIVKLALSASSEVTAVSEALAQETQLHFHLQEKPLVIPNFVDTTRFSPERFDLRLRRAYAAPDEILLVHASNFRPIKQTPSILYILKELLEMNVPARLLMIGDGPERSYVERLAYQLELQERTSFTGSLQEVAPLLAIGDIFILTSAYESFGLAALEALACGVPVVAPAVGGLPEVIKPEAGRLFPPNDVHAACTAILEVLRNLPVYRSGARHIALEYDTHRIVPHYERLYEHMLSLTCL
ncbi:MAG: N-acetyl-alpha-D-glucosaminyl L-malate synthase BshA [Bacteroidia bacterium]|nr:N-acetyl-alpha-D-glucosaminyl L-malate synthase BshA [Bacteroidia bacterium]MDW8015601.1 N-acetyl-alpha-D-glucosaminyl L-malate synthase BshA [Bacteroidia bacterium]